MVIYFEGRTQALEDDAKGVLSLLWAAYPGHPWSVKCDTGMIFIRHMGFPGNKPYGMNIRVTEIDHDAAVMKRKIISLAGEWLERAGMARGRHDAEQETKYVEGIPQHDQPGQPMPAHLGVKVGSPDERELPRPQAIKRG